MKWLVKRNVIFGYGFSLLLLVGVGIVSYRSTKHLVQVNQAVMGKRQILGEIKSLQAQLLELELKQKDLLEQGRWEELTAYYLTIDDEIGDIRRLTAGDASLQKKLDDIDVLVKRVSRRFQNIALRGQSGTGDASAALTGRRIYEDSRRLAREMETYEDELLLQGMKELETSAKRTTLAVVLGSFFAFIFVSAASTMLALELNSRRKIERALEQGIAELNQANEDLEAFDYSVSHDLRVPLVVIGGFVRKLLAEAKAMDEKSRGLLNIVKKEVDRMERLIDRLLDFARWKRKNLETTGIDMNALVHAVFEDLKPLAGERRICLSADALPPARGDLEMVREVLINLFSNAIKFTAGLESAEIEVAGKSTGGENVYYVRDNGIGFPARDADKIFDVFHRLHPGKHFRGSGVGLAIVRRIVEKHGGRVWAEGKEQAGATFYFTLPAV